MTTPSPATTSISHPATIVGDILAIQLSTTTFFPNGTALPVAPSQHSPIPIGSIVGGTIGGIVLAFVLVFGWIWWGRNIERGKRKEKSKILAVLEVRENTRKNASSAVVRDASYFAPAAPSPLPQRSIKFASGSSIASTASTAQLAQALDETKATTSVV
ncbi:hypothetical protein EUX98_g6556 [Antrodiella citrinella]|uniref:Uncharacterized protein n=1 Tax=Antrodiella citrinella TaxID=2447956 RepID=A0A4S4MNZ6_9APHY|nr:hypothetical protein EUX98_g6556 [Antrodiella citrinella]